MSYVRKIHCVYIYDFKYNACKNKKRFINYKSYTRGFRKRIFSYQVIERRLRYI